MSAPEIPRNGVLVAADQTARMLSSLLDGLPGTWRVRGNADGTISIRPAPKRNATADLDLVDADVDDEADEASSKEAAE